MSPRTKNEGNSQCGCCLRTGPRKRLLQYEVKRRGEEEKK